jgi:hypothetical protein
MKNKKAKLVFECLIYPALLLLIARFFVKRAGYMETSSMLAWIAAGLAGAALMVRLIDWLFPRSFDNKPTREQIEEKLFGTDQQEQV